MRATLDVATALGGEKLTKPIDLRNENERWVPTDGNIVALRELSQKISVATTDVLNSLKKDADAVLQGKGKLGALLDRVKEQQALLGALAENEGVGALQTALKQMPPPWTEGSKKVPQGFSADGDADEVTGYPKALKGPAGERLVLVSVPPADTRWVALGGREAKNPLLTNVTQSASASRSWRLYYVEAGKLATADTLDKAKEVAGTRALPTVEEWALAAWLNQEFRTGGRVWCLEGDVAVACGSTKVTIGGKPQVLPPVPDPNANPDRVWDWLNNPLVVQKRGEKFGDQQTYVRSILPVLP